MVEEKKDPAKKGFLARLMETLDKKMEEKAKSGSCCCGPQGKDEGKKGCC